MFDMLAEEGLIRPVFQIHPYEAAASERCVGFIRDAAALSMTQDIRAPLKVRHFLFQVLMRYTPDPINDWLPHVNALQRGYVMSQNDTTAFTRGWQRALDQNHIEPFVRPPDVLWLPVKYHPRFEGNHGISGTHLHRPGESAFLCPVEYYPQIVWHEALHLCFGCDDCYDETTRARDCNLTSCVMQYEPCNSRPESGPWLCDDQRDHIQRRFAMMQEQMA